MKTSQHLSMLAETQAWLRREIEHAKTLPKPWRDQKLRELQARANQLARDMRAWHRSIGL